MATQVQLNYRLVGGNYPMLVLLKNGKETKVADVEWQGDRESTIALADQIVASFNEQVQNNALLSLIDDAHGLHRERLS